ncbi:MAG: PKD domain-containing protein [Bacteroidetes bacterium]|nr:PKD domain-containing protein [Bacteroidota bacterium]
MKKAIIVLAVLFSISVVNAQPWKHHIGLSITVDDDFLDYCGTDMDHVKEYLENEMLPLLNDRFDEINVEFYIYQVFNDENSTNNTYYGEENTIRVKYGASGGPIAGVGLTPGITVKFDQISPVDLLHEFGHIFGLDHPFASWNGDELVVRPGEEAAGDMPANCDYAGDIIRDTPAHLYGPTTGYTDTNGDNYDDWGQNFMDYGGISMEGGFFTTEQYDIMRKVTESAGFANGYINQYYIDDAHAWDKIADFTYTINPYNDHEITFTAQNSSDFVDFYWEFGDGLHSGWHTTTHEYTSPGKYEVSLLVRWSVNGINFWHERKKIINIAQPIVLDPGTVYTNDFESGNSIDNIYFYYPEYYRTEPRIVYHGLDNNVLAIPGCRFMGEQPSMVIAEFYIDATVVSNLFMYFKHNSLTNIVEPLKVTVNGIELPQDYLYQGNHPDDREQVVIDLSSYVGWKINISFRAEFDDYGSANEDFYFIDDLRFSDVPLTVPYCEIAGTYASCSGVCDAQATVIANGGISPYTFQWEGIPFTEQQNDITVTGLCEDTYYVTITDAYGQTAVSSVTIMSDPDLYNYAGEAILTENTEWTGVNYGINETIEIPAGITLTITGSTIGFGTGGNLRVMPGGELIVDNSTLTNMSACGNRWKGVEVWGNKMLSHLPQYQGMVEIINGSVIENALCGVLLGKRISGTTNDLNYSGGIIRASGTTFRNNVTAVEFADYPGNNTSYIRACRFETDEPLADNSDPYCFLLMKNVKGIYLTGNTYINEVPDQYFYNTRGIGVLSVGSQFFMDDYCSEYPYAVST